MISYRINERVSDKDIREVIVTKIIDTGKLLKRFYYTKHCFKVYEGLL